MGCTPCTTKKDECSGANGCTDCANKCHEVVNTYAEIVTIRNAFVTVRDENAVYHVDEIGNPVAVSRSAIFKDNYTPTEGDYKQNVVYDLAAGKAYVYNALGQYKQWSLA